MQERNPNPFVPLRLRGIKSAAAQTLSHFEITACVTSVIWPEKRVG